MSALDCNMNYDCTGPISLILYLRPVKWTDRSEENLEPYWQPSTWPPALIGPDWDVSDGKQNRSSCEVDGSINQVGLCCAGNGSPAVHNY
jgi:hypothetical protein